MLQVNIQIKGQIDKNWSDSLGGLEITYAKDGNTVLTGNVRDQATLYGLLSQFSDLGLQLISVKSQGENNPGRQQ